jgi:hypothetical protein
MVSDWDHLIDSSRLQIESSRSNERRARADIDDLRLSLDETRRVIAASRKLLGRMANRVDEHEWRVPTLVRDTPWLP